MKNFFSLSRTSFLVLFVMILGIAAFLRLYKLDQAPPSLYWEEVALGYDAYSIAQTGKDHHGNSFPIVAFTSFGDFKPSGYFYMIVPFIWMFGLNEWAVRLPSAIAGILTVVGVGFLVRFYTEKLWGIQGQRHTRVAQLIGMGFAAGSPWLIQFSRGGWEVNAASSLLLWSMIAGLYSTHEGKRLLKLLVCFVLAGLSMYVYHATRLVAPGLLAGLCLIWIDPIATFAKNGVRGLWKKSSLLIIPGILFLVLVMPLLLSSGNVSTQQRFAETSITGDGQYVLESNRLRELSGDSPLSKLFTHRYVILGQQVAVAFASHFRPDFLFVSGDQNPRHSTGFTGIMNLTDALWLFVGVGLLAVSAFHNKALRPFIFFLVWWLVIGIFPAAITKAYPHALRVLPTAPVFLTLISVGALQSMLWLSKKLPQKLAQAGILLVLFIMAGYWFASWRYYMTIYPSLSQADWQYGYKEMVQKVHSVAQNNPSQAVFITREYGRPAMYYWFYTQTPPQEVQAAEATAKKDQSEFLSYQQIEFINSVNEAKPGIIVSSITGYEQLAKQFSSVQKLDEVKDLRGNVVWVISQLGQE